MEEARGSLASTATRIARRRSVYSDLRVLLAVAKKEWTIFVRYPSWVIAILVWPVIFPLGYIFTAKALSGPSGASTQAFDKLAGTADYMSFIVLGTVMWMWLNMTLWDIGGHIREEQMRGTLESNWLCPVSRLGIMVGASLSKLIQSLLFLAITALEFRLVFGIDVLAGNFLLLLVTFLLIIPSIYGIGILFGSLVIRFKESNAMVFLVRGVFMVFCGITYPLEVLPGWMKTVSEYLPLTYAIRDVRAAVLLDATVSQMAPDLVKLAAFGIALPLLGALAFAFTERRARQSGTLGKY